MRSSPLLRSLLGLEESDPIPAPNKAMRLLSQSEVFRGAKERGAVGVPNGSFQVLQHIASDM